MLSRAQRKFGAAWQGANFETIDKTTEVAPGITLIALVSEAPGTRELKELSLAINTSDGVVLVVGCSHPGIEKIVEAAAAINPKIHLIAGGFHLVVATDDVISKAVTDGVEDRVHDVLDVPLIQMRVPLGDLQNQFGFDHRGSARSLNLRHFSKAGCQTARSPSRFRQRTTRKGSQNLVGLCQGGWRGNRTPSRRYELTYALGGLRERDLSFFTPAMP